MQNVVITGGSEGIGLGLAARFLARSSSVLVTGRSREKLELAVKEHPGLRIFVNDIGRPEERETLAAHVRDAMPDVDLLVNNAGYQRRVPLAADHAPWAGRQAEIDVLLSGPIHLNDLLIPTLLAHGRPSAIVNVTSGGAYIPQPFAPVYSASKAALHSYTMTLRHALAATTCRVRELIPPAVATGLAGPGASHGAPLDDFCDTVFKALTSGGDDEIGYGPTGSADFRDRSAAAAEAFGRFAGRFPVETYA